MVDKHSSTLRVYHTSLVPVWSLGDLPEKLTMLPTAETDGRCTQWPGSYELSYELSLSVPHSRNRSGSVGDDAYWGNARKVLEFWIEVEKHNLTLIRAGLFRFRMPHEYKTNVAEVHAIVEQGSQPSDDLLRRGVLHLSECLNCLGSQFHYSDNPLGAVEAGLLFRHLRAVPAVLR